MGGGVGVRTAVGPALGGALTEAFDWRAIFLARPRSPPPGRSSASPLVRGELLEAAPEPERGESRAPAAPMIALGLLSAALTAVIFLVVLLLVAGWSTEPLVAALAVSAVPAPPWSGRESAARR